MTRWRLAAAFAVGVAGSVMAREFSPPVVAGKDGRLVYETLARGDRVPDYSHAGYRGGGVALPVLPARVSVAPVDGDDGARIQAAIDFVSGLAPDAAGWRGAVQLLPGRYEIAGQVKIKASGVVLRGAGAGEDGTVLVATGTDRRPLIEVAGRIERKELAPSRAVAGEYVPLGARELHVSGAEGLAVGQRVTIERPSPPAWLNQLGMDVSPGRQPYLWKAGTVNVRWDRVITALAGDRLTLDAPLTTSLDEALGGGTVTPYAETGYLVDVGVENLRCESEFDRANPLDEQHAWNAIDLHAVRDAWVADVMGVHFAGSVVQVGALAARVTVQDCISLAPVSEPAGYRRMAFHARGQQVLFLRCLSEQGRNDFTTGYQTAGPVVFLDCAARASSGFSGSIGAWSSGLLFDGVKIDGGALRQDNLETFNQGVGWAAANSMIWQSEAAVIVSRQPPGAHNWAVAVWGQYVGDGRWSMTNQFAQPGSLYRAQLAERLGPEALKALEPNNGSGERKLAGGAASRLTTAATGKALEEVVPDWQARIAPKPEGAGKPLVLANGVLMVGGERLAGKTLALAWWLGRLEPARASEPGPALTRFAPGRTGTGLTDEIPAVVARMKREGAAVVRHHYGLWYDRRRIDHQMIRRPDTDVWPPFFEQPFARSGQGTAWDGLSRYDLTKYNPWYFGRLRAFAAEARREGVVLINEMYFQHNIIESGAHWVDSPWRPVNNVNDTGFTEPPPFTGDTIKMADEFYDVTHPVRRTLHRAYIRHHLDELGAESNVIHTLTAENSGPLPFMQFWLDVVTEWERETGRHPLIALSAPKDVQDAILADSARAAIVDVIDLTYWFRAEKGGEFAPAGGQSLAPRQHLRQWKGGRPNAAMIAEMAREYRRKHPGKAVITGLAEAGDVQPAGAGNREN
ncbi:MAG TPA: DUF6298 domain-containing protein [Lacunisphaera sp.]|nr:DUF6298 domain-containing protein [Lacunisphaera sp.]